MIKRSLFVVREVRISNTTANFKVLILPINTLFEALPQSVKSRSFFSSHGVRELHEQRRVKW